MAGREQGDRLKSSLAGFLSALWDLLLLNFLWLVCSLPVLTLGPATSALFSVTLKLARDEMTRPAADFLRAFRDNFRQGLALGLLWIGGAAVMIADLTYAMSVTGAMKIVFGLVAGVWAAGLLTCLGYAFPLVARYRNPLRGQLRNAFSLAVLSPGRTLLLWAIFAFPVLLLLALPQEAAARLGVFYLMMGVSGPALLASRVLRGVFDRFENNPAKEND